MERQVVVGPLVGRGGDGACVVVAFEHDRRVGGNPAGAHHQRRAGLILLHRTLDAVHVSRREIGAERIVEDAFDARARRDDQHARRRGKLYRHRRPVDALLRKHDPDPPLNRRLHGVLEAARGGRGAVTGREVGDQCLVHRGVGAERPAEAVEHLRRQRLHLPAQKVEPLACLRTAEPKCRRPHACRHQTSTRRE